MAIDLLQQLTTHRFLAIVRGEDAESATDAVCRLIDLGVGLVEVSLTGHGALDSIRAAVDRAAAAGGRTLVGAGTVVTEEDLDHAHAAGATFAVTPTLSEGFEACIARGVPVLAGALTPTEVVHAWRSGAAAVKIFPASAVPSGYVRALRDPFPHIPLVPVGGVTTDAARRYLADGAVAVGVGGPLLGDAGSGGDLDQLGQRLEAFTAAVQV